MVKSLCFLLWVVVLCLMDCGLDGCTAVIGLVVDELVFLFDCG